MVDLVAADWRADGDATLSGLRTQARRKRVDAEQNRRVARCLSFNPHRDRLLEDAAALEAEAARLERAATELEKGI